MATDQTHVISEPSLITKFLKNSNGLLLDKEVDSPAQLFVFIRTLDIDVIIYSIEINRCAMIPYMYTTIYTSLSPTVKKQFTWVFFNFNLPLPFLKQSNEQKMHHIRNTSLHKTNNDF